MVPVTRFFLPLTLLCVATQAMDPFKKLGDEIKKIERKVEKAVEKEVVKAVEKALRDIKREVGTAVDKAKEEVEKHVIDELEPKKLLKKIPDLQNKILKLFEEILKVIPIKELTDIFEKIFEEMTKFVKPLEATFIWNIFFGLSYKDLMLYKLFQLMRGEYEPKNMDRDPKDQKKKCVTVMSLVTTALAIWASPLEALKVVFVWTPRRIFELSTAISGFLIAGILSIAVGVICLKKSTSCLDKSASCGTKTRATILRPFKRFGLDDIAEKFMPAESSDFWKHQAACWMIFLPHFCLAALYSSTPVDRLLDVFFAASGILCAPGLICVIGVVLGTIVYKIEFLKFLMYSLLEIFKSFEEYVKKITSFLKC